MQKYLGILTTSRVVRPGSVNEGTPSHPAGICSLSSEELRPKEERRGQQSSSETSYKELHVAYSGSPAKGEYQHEWACCEDTLLSAWNFNTTWGRASSKESGQQGRSLDIKVWSAVREEET